MEDANRAAQPAPSGTRDAGEATSRPRGLRAAVVTCVGLVVILLIALAGYASLPEPLSKNLVDTKGPGVIAVASAAFTAVSTIIAAYLGVRAANLAREDSGKTSERHEIRVTELAGAEPTGTSAANRRATDEIKRLGL